MGAFDRTRAWLRAVRELTRGVGDPTAEGLADENARHGWAAETEHYRVGCAWERVYLLRDEEKPVRIGTFLGGMAAAAIDPAERWCVMVGRGLIAYRLAEPFAPYPEVFHLDDFITSYRSGQWWDWGRSFECPSLGRVEYLDGDRFRVTEGIDLTSPWKSALIEELIATSVVGGHDPVAGRLWWLNELERQAAEQGVDLGELAIDPEDGAAIARLVDAGTPLIAAVTSMSPSPHTVEPRVFVLHAEEHRVIEQPRARPAD